MENLMAMQNEEQIRCLDDDGDEALSSIQEWLWSICLSAQWIFDAEVIFLDKRYSDSWYIEFFVPRDHPRVADVEAYLAKALEPVRQELASWDLQKSVCVYLYRYSGFEEARAFANIVRRVLSVGRRLKHPDSDRLCDFALEEG